jgi:hypothetical protein
MLRQGEAEGCVRSAEFQENSDKQTKTDTHAIFIFQSAQHIEMLLVLHISYVL